MLPVVSIEVSNANVRGALIDIHELDEHLNITQFLGPNHYFGKPNRLDSNDPDRFISTVAEMALHVADASKATAAVKCVGVALSGAVGEGEAIWIFPGNGRPLTWNVYDVLLNRLEHGFGHPVSLVFANRAHMAAWGEYRFRQKRHKPPSPMYPNMIYLTIGGSVGAGLVSNGHLHVGSNNSAGLIGHIPIDPNSALDPCPGCSTRGCLSTVASGRAVVREYLALGKRNVSERVQADSGVSDDDQGKMDVGYREQWDPGRSDDQDQGGYIDALSIIKAAEPGHDGIDSFAVQAVKAIAQPLMTAIVQMSMFYDPGITILGGIGCLSNVLRNEIEDLAKSRLPPYLLNIFKIQVPHLSHPTYGDVAALFGMAWYAAQECQAGSIVSIASLDNQGAEVAPTMPLARDDAVRPVPEQELRN